jgi:hypothetical protein
LLNYGYNQQITLKPAKDFDPKEAIKKDNIVYIKTTKEQDAIVTDSIAKQLDNMDNVKYRLWTNNCVDSFTNACAPANIDLPSNVTARPDKYFEKLKKMYPDNKTNKAY